MHDQVRAFPTPHSPHSRSGVGSTARGSGPFSGAGVGARSDEGAGVTDGVGGADGAGADGVSAAGAVADGALDGAAIEDPGEGVSSYVEVGGADRGSGATVGAN